MLKEGAVADISDVFDDELKGKLVEGITEGADAAPYGDGKVYLAPFIYTPTGFWYNKNLTDYFSITAFKCCKLQYLFIVSIARRLIATLFFTTTYRHKQKMIWFSTKKPQIFT